MDKLATSLISPLGTALMLGLLALLLGRNRWGALLGVVALVWLGVWSLPVASRALAHWVEAPYPAAAAQAAPQAHALVVLGGGIRPGAPGAPIPDLNDGADRVWHAARLYKAGKAPVVVLSGGSNMAVHTTSEAEAMRVFLKDLGVPERVILLEERSRNTRQNAIYTAKLLRARGMTRILLVTSAQHMPRAVALFEAQGLHVIPAATDHEEPNRFDAPEWIPSAAALNASSRVFKELVGRATGR